MTSIRWLKDGQIQVEAIDLEALGAAVDLPFQLDRYFDQPAGSAPVALARLILTRARPKGVANAARLMHAAYQGEHPRRKPVTIRAFNNDFVVEDGNSTVLNAIASNWPEILCLRSDAPV